MIENTSLVPTMRANEDPMAEIDENTPDIRTMQEEYNLALTQDHMTLARVAAAEAVRYSRWAGQNMDGRVHQEDLPEGQRAMPYDRGPDTRIPLADSIINYCVDLCYTSFWSARLKTSPTTGKMLNAAQAGELRAVISWLIHGPLKDWLVDGVEFTAQMEHMIGWVAVHAGWRREMQLRYQKLSMDEIVALVQQTGPDGPAAILLQLIADPSAEDQAVAFLQEWFQDLKANRARKVVRELRETGYASFPVPHVSVNAPELKVLIPSQDIVLPAEGVSDPQNSRWIAFRQYFTEAGLRARAKEEEWEEGFVEACLLTKGESLDSMGMNIRHDDDENAQLVEIVYLHTKGVNEDGVRCLYCTVFSPHVQASASHEQPLYGKHWMLDDTNGEFPDVFFTTEVIGRRPHDARGVPDIVATQQTEMKTHRDTLIANAELSTLPPMRKRGQAASKRPDEYGPGCVINDPSGTWEALNVTEGAKPEAAFKLFEDVRREMKEYFGVPTADGAPAQWQVRQQRLVRRWLGTWGMLLRQCVMMTYARLTPDELAEVIGRPPLLSAEDIARHRILLWFDVRTLDPDWLNDLIENMAKFVLPADRTGAVDMGKWINYVMQSFDPTLAEEVSVDQQGASQAIYKEVRDEVVAIFQNNEALYRGLEPTAQTKLQFLQQIISLNPAYQMALTPAMPDGRPNERFAPQIAEKMDKYVKNLKQSVVQLQVNPQTGILGVAPAGVELVNSNHE